MVRRNQVESVWEESDDEEADQRHGTQASAVLHEYARQGNHKAVATLIRKAGQGTLKININEPDQNGRTALMIACQYGWTRVVEYLCQAGAFKTREILMANANSHLHRNKTCSLWIMPKFMRLLALF
jgi:hypothetical protein